MRLGVHTFCFNSHGIGQGWAGFARPWGRQLSTFELFDRPGRARSGRRAPGRRGARIPRAASYLREVKAAADERGLYIEYNLSMDLDRPRDRRPARTSARASRVPPATSAPAWSRSAWTWSGRGRSAEPLPPEDHGAARRDDAAAQAPRAARCRLRRAHRRGEPHRPRLRRASSGSSTRWTIPTSAPGSDTVNAFHAMENPMEAIEKLAPRAFTNHFRDDRIEFEDLGLPR